MAAPMTKLINGNIMKKLLFLRKYDIIHPLNFQMSNKLYLSYFTHGNGVDNDGVTLKLLRPNPPVTMPLLMTDNNKISNSITANGYCSSTDRNPLQLMDIPARIWPHALKSIRNLFFNFLIRTYYDSNYSARSLLDGSRQAVVNVSNLISNGNFDGLENLVEKESVIEIKNNYGRLSNNQKSLIAIDLQDIFYHFIYEVGIIFDDSTKRQFVEVTTVMHGVHGIIEKSKGLDDDRMSKKEAFDDHKKDYFICNYSFIRELTRGADADWTISRLNHFLVYDLVDKTKFYDR